MNRLVGEAAEMAQLDAGEVVLKLEPRPLSDVIDAALAQMDKQFGKGSVLRLGSRNVLPVAVISSGSISLDAALGEAYQVVETLLSD